MMWDFYKDETLGDYIDSRLFGDREPISNNLFIDNSYNDAKLAENNGAEIQKEINTPSYDTEQAVLADKKLYPNKNITYDPYQKIDFGENVVEGRINDKEEKPKETVKGIKKEEPKNNNIELKTAKIIDSLAKRVRNKEAMDIINRLQEKVDAQEAAKRNQIVDKETGIRDKVQERRNSGNFSNEEWSKIFKNLLKK